LYVKASFKLPDILQAQLNHLLTKINYAYTYPSLHATVSVQLTLKALHIPPSLTLKNSPFCPQSVFMTLE
jgi:hypothetical protein